MAWQPICPRSSATSGLTGRAPLPREGWPQASLVPRVLNRGRQDLHDITCQARTAPARRCMIYIMRRTQLFLDDQLWEALRARARSEKTTISELVRQAARERYLGSHEARMSAMQGFVGIRKSRSRATDSSEEVRELRRGSRLDCLSDR